MFIFMVMFMVIVRFDYLLLIGLCMISVQEYPPFILNLTKYYNYPLILVTSNKTINY